MELQRGKTISGTFCPACNDLVFHDTDLIPTEVYCPEHGKLVEIPLPEEGPTSTVHVVAVEANTITISTGDGKEIKFK